MSPASPKELADRRDKVGRFIEESTEPIALGAIGRALGLSSHRVTIAIQGLIEEKRIKTVGSGSATRYVAYDSGSGRLIRQAPTQGTPEERIVALLEDRHQATADELAQALREPVQKVVEMCGRLQAEERVRMSNLNGRQVYILAVRV
jgi:Mn-dependent DtxR family transcriptional regulator